MLKRRKKSQVISLKQYITLSLVIGMISLRCFASGNSQFTSQISQYGDEWLGTVFGSVEIQDVAENLNGEFELYVDFELDTSGYLAVGASAGWFLKQYFVSPEIMYGRGDFFDLIDLGLFGAMMLHEKFMIYGRIGHQWREANSFPVIGGKGVFDQTELMTSLGAVYKPFTWLDVSLTLNHNRLLSGNDGITAVENPNINSQSLTIKYKPKYVQPFIRYTHGKHRVSPGDPVLTNNSFEMGISANF